MFCHISVTQDCICRHHHSTHVRCHPHVDLPFYTVYLDTVDRRAPIASRPSDALLKKAVFTPADLRWESRAWVAMFNAVLATHYALNEYNGTALSHPFWWNTTVAMNNATAFFLPGFTNAEVFYIVATSGHHWATPSVSWICVQHSANLLQSAGFPESTRANAESGDSQEELDHKLLLFWAIYGTDRSLALTLGRPPTLRESICHKVPMPRMEQIKDYGRPKKQETDSQDVGFGGLYLMHWIELFRIAGKMLEQVYSPQTGSRTNDAFNCFHMELNAWFSKTSTVSDNFQVTTVAVDRIRKLELNRLCRIYKSPSH